MTRKVKPKGSQARKLDRFIGQVSRKRILLLIISAILMETKVCHSTLQVEEASNEATDQVKQPQRVTVVAQKFLRPKSDYLILLNLANSEQPALIDLQLTGARDSNREQTESKSLLIQSGETQTIKFSIGDWPPAEYVLSVQAQANDRSWNFTREAQLTYKPKSFSGFIQTDKAIYKPGQLVQFRGLFLTKTLTPFNLNNGEINVSISDPKRNLLKQWRQQSTYRGLLSLDYQLSPDPMLGDYTIKLEALNQQISKKFSVAEYILPTFDVDIQLPTYVTYNESDIIATVKATYTYGKPVEGHVTLTVQPLVRFYQIETRPLAQSQYRARLKGGSTDISLDVVKDLKDNEERRNQDHLFEREIEFFALVEEDFTGRVYNKTKIIKLYDRQIKIESINDDRETFKPGLKHKLRFKVAYQDDTPVEDNGPEVELKLGSLGRTMELVRLQPSRGIIEHTIDIPRKILASSKTDTLVTPDYIDLQATYRRQTYYLNSIKRFVSQSNQYMQISLPGQLQAQAQAQQNADTRFSRLRSASGAQPAAASIGVGDTLKVKVLATEPMQQVTCQGLAGGDIVWALSREAKNETSFEFDIKIDQRMAPESTILCFYIRDENKEMITDLLHFKVIGLIRNLAKITSSREEAKPGQEVEINVQTKPNSFVGLLAIDQSVLLLKSGNDISEQDLTNDLRAYAGPDTGEQQQAATNGGSRVSSNDAASLFDEANLIVLTNNLVHSEPSVYYSSVNKLTPESSGRIVLDSLPLEREITPPEFHLNKQTKNDNQIVIRQNFPETWLWQNGTANSAGSYRFKGKIPDTITSWILSAFSMNENFGLGLSGDSKSSIRVFKPFFIKLNLPYSIIRGEIVTIQAVIFNYSKRPTTARVILDNSKQEFELVDGTNKISNNEAKEQAEMMTIDEIKIPAENGYPVSFLIRPKRTGQIDIKMIATSQFASDGINKKLLVKPEGQTQYRNVAMLINLQPPEGGAGGQVSMSKNVSIEIPKNAVEESQKVFVSVVGDIMGPGLSNVDDLLRLPYGCGEQNMINLVPNMVILNYLKNTKRLKESQRSRAVRNIELGYQRQLNYKRSDGSFSAFGEKDSNGSVWLSAYVLKTLQQIKTLITVDEKVVRRAANFIARNAKSDGSIQEIGMLHHKELSSAAAANNDNNNDNNNNNAYLTAYSMIALLQGEIKPDDESLSPVGLDEVLEKGLANLEQQLEAAMANENPYDLAIITYTLSLANRSATSNSQQQERLERAYERLWSKAREEPDLGVWWEAPSSQSQSEEQQDNRLRGGESGKLINQPETSDEVESIFVDKKSTTTTTRQPPPLIPLKVSGKQSEHLFTPNSLSIEMTSFALMSTVLRGQLDRALPIVRWLISQQNSNGGFSSTQDTVLAIEALALFANSNAALKLPLSIDLDVVYPRERISNNSTTTTTIRRNNIDQFLISNTNALVSQQIRLPDSTSWVQLRATGSGSAVLQVSWQYNLFVSAERPAFYLNPILDKTSNLNYIQLSICTYYKGSGGNNAQSNMAVMEVELPSGYVADVEALPGLSNIQDVKRVDTSNGDTKVIIYLDKVTREKELCLTVPAHRTTKVTNNKPVPVTIYDYYNRQQVARIFYVPPKAS